MREPMNLLCRGFSALKALVRNLSPIGEFILVLTICFGPGLCNDAWKIATATPVKFTSVSFGVSVIYEIFLLLCVSWIGQVRGWSFANFGLRISLKLTAYGVGLFIVVFAIEAALGYLLDLAHPQKPGFESIGLTLPAIIILSVINPIFEEVLEAGYFIHSLQRFGKWGGVVACGLLRALLHAYQGINGAVNLFVFGVLFGLAYWRMRQLWPLIVAHALADLVGLLFIAHGT
jgi:uncharacterized protein